MDYTWHYLLASIVTLLLLPLLRAALRAVRSGGARVLDGLVYWGARYLGRSLYGTLTIKRYCRLLLGRQEHRYLHVPSRLDDVKLDIDAVYVALSLESRGMQATYSHRDLLTLGNRIQVGQVLARQAAPARRLP
jgi:hypothetical protein